VDATQFEMYIYVTFIWQKAMLQI